MACWYRLAFPRAFVAAAIFRRGFACRARSTNQRTVRFRAHGKVNDSAAGRALNIRHSPRGWWLADVVSITNHPDCLRLWVAPAAARREQGRLTGNPAAALCRHRSLLFASKWYCLLSVSQKMRFTKSKERNERALRRCVFASISSLATRDCSRSGEFALCI